MVIVSIKENDSKPKKLHIFLKGGDKDYQPHHRTHIRKVKT